MIIKDYQKRIEELERSIDRHRRTMSKQVGQYGIDFEPYDKALYRVLERKWWKK